MTPLELAVQFGQVLDDAGIEYAVGGSVASSMFGEPRSTLDIDFALRGSAEAFDEALLRAAADFYIPTAAASRAILSNDSFNLLHNASGIKIDVFVLGEAFLDRRQIERRVKISLEAGDLWVTSPLDIVLRKLWWFQLSEERSERQWRDVIGLLRVTEVDDERLQSDAIEADLGELAQRAIAEAATGPEDSAGDG